MERIVYSQLYNSANLMLYRVFQKSRTSLTRYILRYENSIAIKEVCLDRVTLHNLCDTKHDPIDDLLNKLPQFKGISLKPQ